MLKLRVAFLAVAALGAALLGLAAGRSDASRPDATPPRGGTFRVVFAPPEQLDTHGSGDRQYAGILVAP